MLKVGVRQVHHPQSAQLNASCEGSARLRATLDQKNVELRLHLNPPCKDFKKAFVYLRCNVVVI